VLTVGVTFHGGTLRTVGELDFMKPLFVGVFLFVSCALALAQAVPLPRAKPQLSGAADPPLPQVLPLHDAQVWPSNCTLRLVELHDSHSSRLLMGRVNAELVILFGSKGSCRAAG
jgi:hypothetical protein